MDDVDRAQAREEELRDDALAAFHRRQPAPRAGAEFCVHCEETIPEARRRAVPGCQLCVACQAYFEMVMETGG
jgi:phage/conjugal plasmid C-4 type zinc finger TraR family protein